jgi:hypothetical protein
LVGFTMMMSQCSVFLRRQSMLGMTLQALRWQKVAKPASGMADFRSTPVLCERQQAFVPVRVPRAPSKRSALTQLQLVFATDRASRGSREPPCIPPGCPERPRS